MKKEQQKLNLLMIKMSKTTWWKSTNPRLTHAEIAKQLVYSSSNSLRFGQELNMILPCRCSSNTLKKDRRLQIQTLMTLKEVN